MCCLTSLGYAFQLLRKLTIIFILIKTKDSILLLLTNKYTLFSVIFCGKGQFMLLNTSFLVSPRSHGEFPNFSGWFVSCG